MKNISIKIQEALTGAISNSAKKYNWEKEADEQTLNNNMYIDIDATDRTWGIIDQYFKNTDSVYLFDDRLPDELNDLFKTNLKIAKKWVDRRCCFGDGMDFYIYKYKDQFIGYGEGPGIRFYWIDKSFEI